MTRYCSGNTHYCSLCFETFWSREWERVREGPHRLQEIFYWFIKYFSWKFFYSFGLNTHATSKFLMPINTLSTDLSDIVLVVVMHYCELRGTVWKKNWWIIKGSWLFSDMWFLFFYLQGEGTLMPLTRLLRIMCHHNSYKSFYAIALLGEGGAGGTELKREGSGLHIVLISDGFRCVFC